MPKLPVVKPKEVIKVLQKMGFVKRRSSGSHQLFSNQAGLRVIVAYHNKDINLGLCLEYWIRLNCRLKNLINYYESCIGT